MTHDEKWAQAVSQIDFDTIDRVHDRVVDLRRKAYFRGVFHGILLMGGIVLVTVAGGLFGVHVVAPVLEWLVPN